jgi:hypothetical protein
MWVVRSTTNCNFTLAQEPGNSSSCGSVPRKCGHPSIKETQGHNVFSCHFDEFLLTFHNLSMLLPTNSIQHVPCTVNRIADYEESCASNHMNQQAPDLCNKSLI